MKYFLILLAFVLFLYKLLYLDKESPQVQPDIVGEELPTQEKKQHSNILEPVALDEASPANFNTANETQEGSPESLPTSRALDNSIDVQSSGNGEGSPLLRGEKVDKASDFGSHLNSGPLSPEGSGPVGTITGVKSDKASDGSHIFGTVSDGGSILTPPSDGVPTDGSAVDSNGSNLSPNIK